MISFKPGDKVIAIASPSSAEYQLIVGMMYTVKSSDYLLVLKEDTGYTVREYNPARYRKELFKLVNPKKYNLPEWF